MTERRYGYIRGMQYRQNPDEEPTIDELVREYMGMVPPDQPAPPPPPLDPAAYAPLARPGDQIVTPSAPPPAAAPR
jgi:general secretion pathway protein D